MPAGAGTQAPDEKVLVQRFINVVENKASIVKQDVRSLWAAWDKGPASRVSLLAAGYYLAPP